MILLFYFTCALDVTGTHRLSMEGHNQLGEDLKNAIPTTVPDDVSTVTDSELYSSLWNDGECGGGEALTNCCMLYKVDVSNDV